MASRARANPLFAERRYLILIGQLLLTLLILFVILWWGFLLWIQTDRLEQLQNLLGDQRPLSSLIEKVSHRLVIGESLFFIIALLCIAGYLYLLNWRDLLRSRSVRSFFAGVTHELRTPLTSIRLQAESLADSSISGPYREKLIQRLLEDTSRLESELEKTLELARLEGGGPLLIQTYTIGPLIETTLAQLRTRLSKEPHLEVKLTSDLVYADPTSVAIIFRNLLENSIRHGHTDQLKVSVNAEASSKGVIVRYLDNGQGFDEHENKLGTLFYKGSKSHGAGVGLYLIKSLMERMGGRATFRGKPHFQANLFFVRG